MGRTADDPQPLDYAVVGLCLSALAALPWLVSFWPGQDNPNHLAVTHVLGHVTEPPFAAALTRDLCARPFVLIYWVLLGLGKLVGLMAANRVVVSGLVAALPLAVLFFLRRHAPERWANVFLLAPFATGWVLMVGMMGFLLGLTLGVVCVTLAWDSSAQALTRRTTSLAAAAIFFLFATLAHGFAALLTAGMLLALLGRNAWQRRTHAALVLAPGAVLWLSSLPSMVRGSHILDPTPLCTARTLRDLVECPAPDLAVRYQGIVPSIWLFLTQLVTISKWEFPFRAAALLCLVSAVRLRREQPLHPRETALRRMGFALLIGFFVLPTSLPYRVNAITDRMPLVMVVCLSLLAGPARWQLSPVWRRMTGLLLCVPLSWVQYGSFSQESNRIADIVAAMDAAPPGITLLPLHFRPQGVAINLRPELHAWGYGVLRRNALVPYMFADGGTSYYGRAGTRPLAFRKSFGSASLPFVPESFAWWTTQSELSILLDTGSRYDRVLVVDPPNTFLDLCSNRWVAVAHVGDAWLFTPHPGS